MSSKKKDARGFITAKWTNEGPDVLISNFEKLSPTKIEKCFEAAMKEWYRLRAVCIGERRVKELKERKAAETTGAENG